MWNVHVRSSFQEHRFGDGSGTGTWEYFGGYARAASIEDINVLNWPLSVATALEHSSVRDCSERSRAASDPIHITTCGPYYTLLSFSAFSLLMSHLH
jgi:hypothetical protein